MDSTNDSIIMLRKKAEVYRQAGLTEAVEEEEANPLLATLGQVLLVAEPVVIKEARRRFQ